VIPEHDAATGNLPAGEHVATWDEICKRFGGNARREGLLNGLQDALGTFRRADIPTVYIDGSFVSMKEMPGDYDVCWDYDEFTDLNALDPVFFDFALGRLAQKTRFGGEFFPAAAIADGQGTTYRYFFQQDKRTQEAKGIIVLDLRAEEAE
jgi:hypothetical protein